MAVWLMLFLSPLMFSHEQTISLVRVAAFSIFPLCMMTVFYTNYLWLVPRYYIAHEERFYWIFNMIMYRCFYSLICFTRYSLMMVVLIPNRRS